MDHKYLYEDENIHFKPILIKKPKYHLFGGNRQTVNDIVYQYSKLGQKPNLKGKYK